MKNLLEGGASPQRVEYQWRVGPHEQDTFKVLLERKPGQSDEVFREAFRVHVDAWLSVHPRWVEEDK